MQNASTVPEVLSRQQSKDTEKKHTIKERLSGLSELNRLAFNTLKQQSPNVPEYALPKPNFRDKTSNDLCKSVVKWCQLNGQQAERISVEGRVLDTRQTITDALGRRKVIGSVTRIKSSAQRGSADVSATIAGRSVKIEIKIGSDTQSDEQKTYQRQIESAGGIYLIVKTFQGFYEWFLRFRKEVGNG